MERIAQKERTCLIQELSLGCLGVWITNERVKSFFEKRPPNFQSKMPDDAPNVYPWWERVNIASSAKASRLGSKL